MAAQQHLAAVFANRETRVAVFMIESSIEDHLFSIEQDVYNLTDIEDGTCTNDKIC